MRSKLLAEERGQVFALVFDHGDEAMGELLAFAQEHGLSAAHLTGLGAFRDATVAFFNWEHKDYDEIRIDEQVEVLSLVGDVALNERDEPQLHVHVVLGKADGTAHGGHLVRAIVRPTLEVVLEETPPDLRRRSDPESGLALIRP
jgi:uncharacterized protein